MFSPRSSRPGARVAPPSSLLWFASTTFPRSQQLHVVWTTAAAQTFLCVKPLSIVCNCPSKSTIRSERRNPHRDLSMATSWSFVRMKPGCEVDQSQEVSYPCGLATPPARTIRKLRLHTTIEGNMVSPNQMRRHEVLPIGQIDRIKDTRS